LVKELVEGNDLDLIIVSLHTQTNFNKFSSDSGGPLACNDVLVGIVSYGTRVCAINVPDVYTRNYSTLNRITNKIYLKMNFI
jgi:secreted trypsin-like serine protease